MEGVVSYIGARGLLFIKSYAMMALLHIGKHRPHDAVLFRGLLKFVEKNYSVKQ